MSISLLSLPDELLLNIFESSGNLNLVLVNKKFNGIINKNFPLIRSVSALYLERFQDIFYSDSLLSKKLKKLSLVEETVRSDCIFLEWVAETMNLPKIEAVNLKEKISNLEQQLKEFKIDYSYLKLVNLVNKDLVVLPSKLENIPTVQYLFLNGNRFKEFPDLSLYKRCLNTLHLHDNAIEKIPDDINEYVNLRCLLLNNNKIDSIPQRVTEIPKLFALGIDKDVNLQELKQKKPRLIVYDDLQA